MGFRRTVKCTETDRITVERESGGTDIFIHAFDGSTCVKELAIVIATPVQARKIAKALTLAAGREKKP